jgi:hypothetical protein
MNIQFNLNDANYIIKCTSSTSKYVINLDEKNIKNLLTGSRTGSGVKKSRLRLREPAECTFAGGLVTEGETSRHRFERMSFCSDC